MRYAALIEQVGTGYSAFVPDLPGCIATGNTLQEAEIHIREAVRLHVEGMLEDGVGVPEPTTVLVYVEAV